MEYKQKIYPFLLIFFHCIFFSLEIKIENLEEITKKFFQQKDQDLNCSLFDPDKVLSESLYNDSLDSVKYLYGAKSIETYFYIVKNLEKPDNIKEYAKSLLKIVNDNLKLKFESYLIGIFSVEDKKYELLFGNNIFIRYI